MTRQHKRTLPERLMDDWCRGQIASLYDLCVDLDREARMEAFQQAIGEAGPTDSVRELCEILRDRLADLEVERGK